MRSARHGERVRDLVREMCRLNEAILVWRGEALLWRRRYGGRVAGPRASRRRRRAYARYAQARTEWAASRSQLRHVTELLAQYQESRA